ncbi:acetyl-CoA carboxylase biotin carboxyl carrier protein [Gracilinema caldarium]|uniref:Biotin carboxyl carrier protein of acetyl-CoA carboxylase n=1 Tax=Gracilinema caldarium (strain ATCC 51460 / DSM 7334 / H1) TaxID=744872 RepID=F8EZE5_GRAC1|nr:acetyl-CoA carboxylase biotin carboxyl carrier protein [Gracilinema caldarium]AEJ20168.1 acetyl-CoA carboxylase, biotin carboxyl carrier protein [Gracilinema caldarium DSM 7334]
MDDKTLITLVEKFGSSQLAELELNDGSLHLVLRKEGAIRGNGNAGSTAVPAVGAVGTVAAGSTSMVNAASDHTTAAEHAVHLGLPVNAGSPAATGEVITSPIVATFYRSASPDAPPFVEVGTKVKAGQTLCILEAMKMMNHLEAEFDCEILTIKAENGAMVEYGQALFEVKRL